jgi:hypothetical protein
MSAIIAFLISLAPFIPVMLQLAGMLISWFGASAANLAAYQAMIQQNKDAGLITVETAQRLADYHQQMADDYAKKQAAHQAIADAARPKPSP